MLKIAHLSDLHILKDYKGSYMEETISQRSMPTDYLISALKEVVKSDPDVLVLTGDLVHEGKAEDYRYLKNLLDRYAPGLRVIPVLGNHDIKKEFYRGFSGTDQEGPMYGVEYVGDYRFIVLDTTVERDGNGHLLGKQVNWLFHELEKPYGKGTVLLAHHPLESEQAWFHTEIEENLIERLQETDVIAWLCGHAHFHESRQIGKFVQLTTEALNYGVETREKEVVYTEARGYSTCWLKDDGRVISHLHMLMPFNPVFFRFDLGK